MPKQNDVQYKCIREKLYLSPNKQNNIANVLIYVLRFILCPTIALYTVAFLSLHTCNCKWLRNVDVNGSSARRYRRKEGRSLYIHLLKLYLSRNPCEMMSAALVLSQNTTPVWPAVLWLFLFDWTWRGLKEIRRGLRIEGWATHDTAVTKSNNKYIVSCSTTCTYNIMTRLYRLTHNSTPPNLWAATELWGSSVLRCSVQSSVLLVVLEKLSSCM